MEIGKFEGNNRLEGGVSYIVYEGAISRMERMQKRMWILCIIMFLAFVISNCAWIWIDRQYETIKETTTFEAEQTANADDGDAIINDGVNISNGDSKAESESH